jgi:hypothetical protein
MKAKCNIFRCYLLNVGRSGSHILVETLWLTVEQFRPLILGELDGAFVKSDP